MEVFSLILVEEEGSDRSRCAGQISSLWSFLRDGKEGPDFHCFGNEKGFWPVHDGI